MKSTHAESSEEASWDRISMSSESALAEIRDIRKSQTTILRDILHLVTLQAQPERRETKTDSSDAIPENDKDQLLSQFAKLVDGHSTIQNLRFEMQKLREEVKECKKVTFDPTEGYLLAKAQQQIECDLKEVVEKSTELNKYKEERDPLALARANFSDRVQELENALGLTHQREAQSQALIQYLQRDLQKVNSEKQKIENTLSKLLVWRRSSSQVLHIIIVSSVSFPNRPPEVLSGVVMTSGVYTWKIAVEMLKTSAKLGLGLVADDFPNHETASPLLTDAFCQHSWFYLMNGDILRNGGKCAMTRDVYKEGSTITFTLDFTKGKLCVQVDNMPLQVVFEAKPLRDCRFIPAACISGETRIRFLGMEISD